MPTIGRSVLDIGNNGDIQNARNNEQRDQLMRAAILDAIERVASIDISVVTTIRTSETREGEYGLFSEQFVNETLQRYHVRWQRTGEFIFQRDERSKRVWICSVAGSVVQLEALPMPDQTQRMEERTRAYVLAKRKGTVYLAVGADGSFKEGERYEVLRKRGGLTDKPVGRIVVGEADGELPIAALIVTGRHSIKERYTLRPASFPILRGGLRVSYFERDAFSKHEGAGTDQTVSGFSLDYFEYSILDGFGINLGVDLITDRASDSLQFQSLAVRIGGMAHIPLVSEVLYLRPIANIGYIDLHQTYGLSGQFMLQGQLDLCLNLGPVDLAAGVRYNHLLADIGFNGVYAVGSLGLDLYRFIPATYEREKPGLWGILKNLSLT
jgi:hypothetical protein